MKNINILHFNIVCFIMSIALSSCDKNESVHDRYDSFNFIEKINFGSEASEQTISFTASQSWNIDMPSDNEWITVFPHKGEAGMNKIMVTVSENGSGEIRKGTFSIKTETKTQNVQVFQDFEDVIFINQEITNFSNSKGEQSIDFVANKNWEASLSDPQNQWCELIPSKGEAGMNKLTVKVKKNTGPARKVTITITVGKQFQSKTIYQEEYKLVLKLTNKSYPNWENCQPYVTQEFGEGWVVADWQDILKLDDPRGWAKDNGMKNWNQFKITYNGESSKYGKGYYIAYFPDGLPPGQGSITNYDCFFVGRWNMKLKVVAKKVD